MLKCKNFQPFFFWRTADEEEEERREKIRSDNKVLQVKADNTSYVFTFPFPFVLQPTAKNAKNHKTDSNSICHSFFLLLLLLSQHIEHYFPMDSKALALAWYPYGCTLYILRLDRFHFFLACLWTSSSCALRMNEQRQEKKNMLRFKVSNRVKDT